MSETCCFAMAGAKFKILGFQRLGCQLRSNVQYRYLLRSYCNAGIIRAGFFKIQPNLARFSDIIAGFSDIQRFFYRISLSIVPNKKIGLLLSVTYYYPIAFPASES